MTIFYNNVQIVLLMKVPQLQEKYFIWEWKSKSSQYIV